MELRNGDPARWKQNHLANMAEGMEHIHAGQLATQAKKKNAEYWILVLNSGEADRGPLDMLTGARRLEALTGIKLTLTGQKRSSDQSDDQVMPTGCALVLSHLQIRLAAEAT